MKENQRFSILGDSISTYSGYTPRLYVFYDWYTQEEAGMSSVEETWWMQVIRSQKGVLGSNHSISGSTVTGNVSISGTARNRHQALGENGLPDIILVQMGYNDWAYAVRPEEFRQAYRCMLASLQQMYPHAEIICATIVRGRECEDPEQAFFNVDSSVSSRIYSDIIRQCAKEAGVKVADLEKYGVEYKTIDGVHPDVEGMATIADLWIGELSEE